MKIQSRRLAISLAPIAAGLIALLLLAVPASADFSSRDWGYFKPMALPRIQAQDTLVEVMPDLELFAGAAPGLRDVRILESEILQEVAYKLVLHEARKERISISATIRDLGVLPGQYTSFTARIATAGGLHSEIEIITPSRNFRRKVLVHGSDDLSTWIVLQKDQQIFDFTDTARKFSTRNTSISYPQSAFPYLRVRVMDRDDEPLKITGATLSLTLDAPADVVEFPVVAPSRDDSTNQKSTSLIIHLARPGLPSSRLTIVTDEVNFVRNVALESSPDLAVWSPLTASGPIYSYRTPKFTGDNLTVTYPETTDQYLQLTIDDEDNPSLRISAVEVSGILRTLVFVAAPGKEYQLFYGNRLARQPSYDLERILPYLSTKDLPSVELGAEVANPAFEERLPPVTERFPWLLPAVVAIAAVLVGLLLLRILGQARKALPPPP